MAVQPISGMFSFFRGTPCPCSGGIMTRPSARPARKRLSGIGISLTVRLGRRTHRNLRLVMADCDCVCQVIEINLRFRSIQAFWGCMRQQQRLKQKQIRGYSSCMVIVIVSVMLPLSVALQPCFDALSPQSKRGGNGVRSSLPSTVSLELVCVGPP